MRLGIVSDIHEHASLLQIALERFDRIGVDRVVVLGDVAEWGRGAVDCVTLLDKAGAVGVWGNHDYPLCKAAATREERLAARYPENVLRFFGRLVPRLEIDGCLFTHVEPWLDAEDETQLWYLDGPPDTIDKVKRSFAAVANRVIFIGHFHRWQIANQARILSWNGLETVCLGPDDRFLVVFGAVCQGQFGIFDTQTFELTPVQAAT
jgi:predicted phosphodiesterase